jgi:hypothetical protein
MPEGWRSAVALVTAMFGRDLDRWLAADWSDLADWWGEAKTLRGE